MPVSKKDREDYEEGLKDSRKGAMERMVTDVTKQHPQTPAYYKGREGKQLDEDKKEK